jgi:hypothetical protein
MGIKKAIPVIKRAHEEAKHLENFLLDLKPSGHRFYGDKNYPFKLKHL